MAATMSMVRDTVRRSIGGRCSVVAHTVAMTTTEETVMIVRLWKLRKADVPMTTPDRRDIGRRQLSQFRH
jgi:hypothetical protein